MVHTIGQKISIHFSVFCQVTNFSETAPAENRWKNAETIKMSNWSSKGVVEMPNGTTHRKSFHAPKPISILLLLLLEQSKVSFCD